MLCFPFVLALFAASSIGAFGPGGRFHLEHSKDDFGVRSHGVVEELGHGRTKFYPLPQSTAAEYVQLRPRDADFRWVRAAPQERAKLVHELESEYPSNREEVIGPHQVDGDKLWFGNNYYDGEGMRGVGAFGYFDVATRRYTLFSPREIARYEISAIYVEKGVVWLGLDRFGEDISTFPGGLVRWDRATHDVRRFPLEFVITHIRAEDGSLRLSTMYGHAIFRDGEVRRFLTNGNAVLKFPPPPTHY